MERLSNGMLLSKLGINIQKYYKCLKQIPFKILEKGGPIIDAALSYVKDENIANGNWKCHIRNNLNAKERSQLLHKCGLSVEKNISCLTYNSLSTGKDEILPLSLLQHYASNGMAAGNSIQEAIVQGISEIFERFSLFNIFTFKLTPPIIDREILYESFPDINCIIKDIELAGNFFVEIRDCSLGSGLPAYCACLYDRHNHRYAISFGASPSIASGLERLFTEMVQGRSIYDTAWGIAGSPLLLPPFELRRIFRNSTGNFPPEFWFKTPSWEVDTNLLFHSCKNNKDALNWFISICKDAETEIFVRDCSVFGFPSVHVIIPGYSEVMPSGRIYNYYISSLKHASIILDDILKSSHDQLNFLLEFLDFCRKTNSCDILPFTRIHGLENMMPHESIIFFLCRGYAEVGNYNYSKILFDKLSNLMPSYSDVFSYLADYYGLISTLQEMTAREILLKFYDKDTIEFAYKIQSIPINELVENDYEQPTVPIDFYRLIERVRNYSPKEIDKIL